MADAEVIELPIAKPSCFTCRWATFGSTGTFCTEFNEHIILETTAEDCPDYERD